MFYLASTESVLNANNLPGAVFSTAENNVAAIASLTGWYEAEAPYLRARAEDAYSVFAWYPRVGNYPLLPLQKAKPPLTAWAHGGLIEFGYPADGMTTLINGALGADPAALLTGATGGTWMAVFRVPAAGGEAGAGVVGGTLLGTYGPNGFAPPKIQIDPVGGGNTGHVSASGGGLFIADTTDHRNGVWTLATFTVSSTVLTLRINGVQVNTTIGTFPIGSTTGIRSLVVGASWDLAGPGFFFPLVGQIAAVLTFDAPLSSPDLATSEDYLRTRYALP